MSDAIKTCVLTALVVATLIVGVLLDGNDDEKTCQPDATLIRRDLAAGKVCDGATFEWVDDGQTLVCHLEAEPQQYATLSP